MPAARDVLQRPTALQMLDEITDDPVALAFDDEVERGVLERADRLGGEVFASAHEHGLGLFGADGMDEPPGREPVLREHEAEPDHVGILQPLEDLRIAQPTTEQQALGVERREPIERLAVGVDDPHLVAGLAQAGRHVGEPDGGQGVGGGDVLGERLGTANEGDLHGDPGRQTLTRPVCMST